MRPRSSLANVETARLAGSLQPETQDTKVNMMLIRMLAVIAAVLFARADLGLAASDVTLERGDRAGAAEVLGRASTPGSSSVPTETSIA